MVCTSLEGPLAALALLVCGGVGSLGRALEPSARTRPAGQKAEAPRPGGAARVESALPADSVLIEAEDFERSEADAAGVPRAHDLAWASARTALIRFPQVERVEWRFDEPRIGGERRDLWLRYAATREVAVRWTIDDDDWRETRVPASGAFEGRRAWRWARLGTIAARPGERWLALRGAGLRPDCFVSSPAGAGEPAWPPVPAATELPAAVLERLANGPPRAEATWIDEARAATLPDWIERERVGLHTRLSVRWTDEALFTRAEEAAASLGAPAIVRHVKSLSGQCYWRSAYGAVADWVGAESDRARRSSSDRAEPDGSDDANDGARGDATGHAPAEATGGVNDAAEGVPRDPVAAMARRAHDAGLAFVAYYRHQEDRPLAAAQPDWVCRDARGRTIRRANEPRLCFHSPFADVTLARLLELADRGADAVYLDESHQPLAGCWCDWTRDAFERATGLPLPSAASVNEEDALYRRFLAFCEDSLVAELWRWRNELRARHPIFVLLVSSHRQPELLHSRLTLRIASASDVVKTEFESSARSPLAAFFERHPDLALARDPGHSRESELGPAVRRGFGRPSPDAQLALGWALARDGAYGRPPHVWVHALSGAERWRATAAAIVASGGYANLDHPETSLPDAESFAEAFALARDLATPLAGARPLPDLLVHLPERAIDALLPDERAAWARAVGPFSAAWEGLVSAHLPARVLGDDLLAAGVPEGARLLFVPTPERLEARQRASLERFVAGGGRVLETDPRAFVEAARELERPLALEAPPSIQAHWFRAPDGAVVLGLTQGVAWTLRPEASAPPIAPDLRLRVSASARRVLVWPGGIELEIDERASGRGVSLPPLREALTIRVEE